MVLLRKVDLSLRIAHVLLANAAALVWFIGVTVAGRVALPQVALVRCPLGFCAGGYSPEDLYSMLDEIGEEGRAFLYDTLLRADLFLPGLLLVALVIDILWFSRTTGRMSVALQPAVRVALLLIPVLYCVADYLENSAIGQMLRLYPNIEDVMAERASLLTAAKSQLFAASAGIAGALAIAAWGAAVGPGSRPPSA